MKNCRVLIVSHSPLFLDAIDRLLREEGIQVMARAAGLDEVRLSLNGDVIDALIVDNDDSLFAHTQVLADITGDDDTIRRIILLSLSHNRMVVHYRERVENVTPVGLIEAICLKDE